MDILQELDVNKDDVVVKIWSAFVRANATKKDVDDLSAVLLSSFENIMPLVADRLPNLCQTFDDEKLMDSGSKLIALLM